MNSYNLAIQKYYLNLSISCALLLLTLAFSLPIYMSYTDGIISAYHYQGYKLFMIGCEKQYSFVECRERHRLAHPSRQEVITKEAKLQGVKIDWDQSDKNIFWIVLSTIVSILLIRIFHALYKLYKLCKTEQTRYITKKIKSKLYNFIERIGS